MPSPVTPSRKSVSSPYPASVTTTPGGTPSASACLIWSSAIAGLVRNPTSSGTPAIARRAGSAAQGLGQVEPVGDRQRGGLGRDREGHRDLAVVPLPELAAVLAR